MTALCDDMALKKHIELAKSVLFAEAEGIKATADLLDENFDNAVKVILATQEYLIVTGVGKSGHIGRKIAASFASTGTPSFFMHPTEASHGDLGMVRSGCTILAISNSGESRELTDVLSYCKKHDIPIIGITKNKNSTLGRFSSHVLELADTPEACSNGLAPTTSTTNTLALGDALVVATMEEKGVSRDDFGRHHPGGKLGRGLQTVEDWLLTHPHDTPIVPHDLDVENLITAISAGQVGCVAVTSSSGEFIGMVTDGDLRRAITTDFFNKTAENIMTLSPTTLSDKMLMSEVLTVFTKCRISNAFILRSNKPIGVIHIKSLLKEGYL
jgi:arabinose-5-phosphate isomerase